MINISDLNVKFDDQQVLYNINLNIKNGEIVGIVGESGSGKSMTALTVMGLLAEDAQVNGKITFDDEVLFDTAGRFEDSTKCYNKKLLKKNQGSNMSMVFQDPMTSLNPTMRIGKQVGEVLKIHTTMKKDDIKLAVLNILEEVGLRNPEKIYNSYPHELSGGMRQRVMIAMGLILEPEILIADEPTTALDVTIQKQILSLIKSINEKKHTSVMFITHNLNLARDFCNRVIVMEKGRIVEEGTVEEIFFAPKQEYTKLLIGAIPMRTKRRRLTADGEHQ